MAMVTCPNCGEQISDKARKCVHCGEVLIQEEKVKCTECGEELEEGAVECPKCGCPVNVISNIPEIDKPQKVEVTGVKITKKVKIVIWVIIALMIAGAVTFVCINQYQKRKEAEKREKEAQEYEQRVEDYYSNLKLATYTMLTGASEAESCGNLIKQVWVNAIYEEKDDETDKYTRPNGYFVDDFNDALSNLFLDEDFNSRISSIKDNQTTVASLMKELKNPPAEYEDAYEAIQDLYDAYLSLTNLAVNPSGNLQTFSSNFNDADSDTLKYYNAMELYLDE